MKPIKHPTHTASLAETQCLVICEERKAKMFKYKEHLEQEFKGRFNINLDFFDAQNGYSLEDMFNYQIFFPFDNPTEPEVVLLSFHMDCPLTMSIIITKTIVNALNELEPGLGEILNPMESHYHITDPDTDEWIDIVFTHELEESGMDVYDYEEYIIEKFKESKKGKK